MARGVTLANIRTLLKAELRDAQETNTALDTEYNYAIANKQRDLANEFDWPFLKHDWDLPLSPGTRYYPLSGAVVTHGATATINFARPICVTRLWSTTYEPVIYGIGTEQYNIREGVNEQQDPVQNWQFVTNVDESSNDNEIEVWPVPAGAQTLRFTGQREVQTLTSDSHLSDLDDLLLVYFVAADYMALRGQQNAPVILQKAQKHLARLMASYPVKMSPPVKFGGYPDVNTVPVKLVAIA